MKRLLSFLALVVTASGCETPKAQVKPVAPSEWDVSKRYSQLDSSLTSFNITGLSLPDPVTKTQHYLTIYCQHRKPAAIYVTLDRPLSDAREDVRYRIDSLPIQNDTWLFIRGSDIIAPFQEIAFIRKLLHAKRFTLEVVETTQAITFDTEGLASHVAEIESSCPGTAQATR